MIRFADKTTRPQVREMWKTVFGDPDDYLDIYFRHKYRDENTLLYMEGGKAVASLQMLPYRFTFCGTEIPALYLSGVSTLPGYREKGYAARLLARSFEEAARRGAPLMLLVPEEEWLLGFYGRYGFAQTFDAGKEGLPSLKGLAAKYPGDPHAAFREFDSLFRREEMTVQKSFDDFRAIMEEAALFGFPAGRKLKGMARVIDAGELLSLFAGRYEDKSFSIAVYDGLIKGNNALFAVAGGKAVRMPPAGGEKQKDGEAVPADAGGDTPFTGLTADIGELARLLLGYHTSGKGEPFSTLFPEKQPQIHFMLE